MREQERTIANDLAGAVARMTQTDKSLVASRNRVAAAAERLEASEVAYEANGVSVDAVLDARERLSDAESRYYRATLEHAIAEKNVRLLSGSLLESNQVMLEGECGRVYSVMPQKRQRTVDYRCRVTKKVTPSASETR